MCYEHYLKIGNKINVSHFYGFTFANNEYKIFKNNPINVTTIVTIYMK